jgi:hypothetical protein
MNNSRTILISLLLILVAFLIYCNCTKNKENYADMYYNNRLDSSISSRPTFNSNLDPNNMNLRFDPNVYGGFIKGNSPEIGNLSSENKVSTVHNSRERYSHAPGTTDAAQFVAYQDTDYGGLPQDNQGNNSVSQNSKNKGGYETVSNDFASLAGDGTFQSSKVKEDADIYKSSLSNNYNPNTLKYTVPKDLLPAPDMRQPLSRDPSDPSNFMYDRTVFAPLKKRNHNEADRIRGDLDIEPVKTGWFDIATVPTVDLVKGYFGYFNDIQEYQDLQDIAYSRARSQSTGQKSEEESSTTALSDLTGMINKDMLRPRLAYATQPDLQMPSGNAWGQKRSFAL